MSEVPTLFDVPDDRKPFQRSILEHPYAGHTPAEITSITSIEAARRAEPTAASVRGRVLRFIREEPRTDDEIELGLGLRHQTASARRRELVLLGWVKDSGRKRNTTSGRAATIWEAVT